jgi:hypothetical protein
MKALRMIVRMLAPWRTIRRLERDNERLSKALENPLLTGIEWGRERGIEFGMRGSGPQLLAGMFLGWLEEDGKNAPNYLEVTFSSPKGPILVTVHQPDGATPHELQRQAEADVRRLKGELVRLQEEGEWEGQP